MAFGLLLRNFVVEIYIFYFEIFGNAGKYY